MTGVMRSIHPSRNENWIGSRFAVSKKVSTKQSSGTSITRRGGNHFLSARVGINGWSGNSRGQSMKIVILGGGGRLGAALMRDYREQHDVAGFNHAQLDLACLEDVRTKLSAMNF